jgi:dephospho-CoA kinase
MQGPGGALVPAIEDAFPGSTGPDGVLRDALGAKVFGDTAALARLEKIVHPAVAERRAAFLRDHADAPLVIFDIPLLFEKGGAGAVDRVVVVSAPAEAQRRRVLARPGMTEAKFADILARQTADAEKRARADHMVDTGVSLEETEAEVLALIEDLRGLSASATPL